MNRSEKIHFTKDYSAKKDVLYLDLYKAYQKAEQFEKSDIEKAIKRKWPSKNLRQATIYLESAVINSLSMSVRKDELSKQMEETERELTVFRSKGLHIEYFRSNEKLVLLQKNSPKILSYVNYLSTTVFYNLTFRKATEEDPFYLEYLNMMDEIPLYLQAVKYYFKAFRKLTVSGDLLKGESKDGYYRHSLRVCLFEH